MQSTARIAAALRAGLWAAALGVLGGAVGGLSGCRTPAGMTKMKEDGVKVKYVASLDRVVFFGRMNGPNLMYSNMRKVRRESPQAGGEYTSYGGMYSWVAPQSAWVDEFGSARNWPPDPAFDRGPTVIRTREVGGDGVIEAQGPVTRMGLQEWKRFAPRGDDELDVLHRLDNVGEEARTAGVWTVTAVEPGAIIAVPRSREGVRFGKEGQAELWNALTRDEGGWTLVDTGARGWWTSATGGELKAFVDDAPPMIAVWRKGNWFLRIGEWQKEAWAGQNPDRGGEAPVEVYLNFGLKLFEAELVGAIAPIQPGEGASFQERWVIIRSDKPETAGLDAAVQRVWGEWEEEREHAVAGEGGAIEWSGEGMEIMLDGGEMTLEQGADGKWYLKGADGSMMEVEVVTEMGEDGAGAADGDAGHEEEEEELLEVDEPEDR